MSHTHIVQDLIDRRSDSAYELEIERRQRQRTRLLTTRRRSVSLPSVCATHDSLEARWERVEAHFRAPPPLQFTQLLPGVAISSLVL